MIPFLKGTTVLFMVAAVYAPSGTVSPLPSRLDENRDQIIHIFKQESTPA
jgi:hypothetical protein